MLYEVQLLGRVSSTGVDYVHQPVALSFSPTLRSVGEARTALGELAQRWSCDDEVLADARIVLSELMTNGVLHACTELQVGIGLLPGGALRLEVHDDSGAPLLPPPDGREMAANLLDDIGPDEPGGAELTVPRATGRGLAVVRALARAWGWYPGTLGGKVVWAEVGQDAAGWGADDAAGGGSLEYALRPVRLIAVPVRLAKESEEHFDDLFRELQMTMLAAPSLEAWRLDQGPDDLVTRTLGPMADDVKGRLGRLHGPLRRAVWEAVNNGDRLVDVELLADPGLPASLRLAGQLVRQSGRAATDGLLLTEPPPDEILAWRNWLGQELADQMAGKPPRACPFPLSPAPGSPSPARRRRLNAARKSAIVEVRSLLAPEAAPTSGDDEASPIKKAIERVLAFVGGRRAVICLLASDNETVFFETSVGFSAAVGQYWRDFSLSADLPASECIRTGRSLFFRTFAELDERYPIFLATPAEGDPCVACLPLGGGASAHLGCISIGFAQARDFSTDEIEFLEQLAAELGIYISKARGAKEAQSSLERANAVEHARSGAQAATRPEEVLEAIANALVPGITDCAAVYLVTRGGELRYVTNRHRDPDREDLARELLQSRQVQENPAGIVREVLQEGHLVVVQRLTEAAMTAAAKDDHELAVIRRLALGSVAALPVVAGGRVLAVLALGNDVGRFIGPEDLIAAEQVCDIAGELLVRLDWGG